MNLTKTKKPRYVLSGLILQEPRGISATRHGAAISLYRNILLYLLWHGYKNSRYVTVNGGNICTAFMIFDTAKIHKKV